MKKYNVQNYVRYKKDIEENIKRIPKKEWVDYTRDEMIIIFFYSVNNSSSIFCMKPVTMRV